MPNGSENPSLNETNASIIGQGSSGSQLPPRSPNQFGGVRTKSSNSTNTFVDEKELTNNTKAEEYDKYWDQNKYKIKTKEEVLNPIKDWKCGAYEPCSSNDTSFIDYVYTIDLCKKIIEVKNNNENKE